MVFVIAGLLNIVLLVLILRNRFPGLCLWKEDRLGKHGQERKYVCQVCGAVAFTTHGKPPADCRRPDRE